MQKPTYVLLLVITISLLGYTLYYSSTHPPVVTTPILSLEATTTEEVAVATTTKAANNKLLTKTGKTITINEANPNGQSLSSISIIPFGFATNTPITLETNKLTDFFLTDMNGDSFDELVLISTAQGSGSYGEATIYTTAKDQELIPVNVPKITEEDTKQGGLFEGYMGHDYFRVIEGGALVREFPTFTATDTNSNPTGPTKKITYILTEKNGTYSVTFSKDATSTLPASSTTSLIATTTQLSGTSWVWSSATIGTTTVPAPQGEKYTLTFDATKTLHATTDCNTLSGNYVANTQELQIRTLTSTKMFCENSSESVYSELLSQTKTYTIQGTTLTLTLSNKGTVTFKKKK